MSIVVLLLRGVALLAFGGPMLVGARGRRLDSADEVDESVGSRLPVVANIGAFGVFFAILFTTSGGLEGLEAVLFGLAGASLAVAGSVLVMRSRVELGTSWSFVPRAAEQRGIVSSGPYRLVRHPIYLGLSTLAFGEAIAFNSLPGVLAVAAAVVPTFIWRARVEECLLFRLFGERYRLYQSRTKMLVPSLL